MGGREEGKEAQGRGGEGRGGEGLGLGESSLKKSAYHFISLGVAVRRVFLLALPPPPRYTGGYRCGGHRLDPAPQHLAHSPSLSTGHRW